MSEKKGITLVTAVILIVFASAIALSTATFITQRFSQSTVYSFRDKCIYLAQAGLHYAIYQYRSTATPYSGTVSNIDGNNGYAVVATTGGGSGTFVVNSTNANLSNSNTYIVNDTVTNNSSSAVVVNQITVTWTKSPKTLKDILINNVTVWSGGISTSPAVCPVSNFTIPANTTYNITRVRFNSSMGGETNATILFQFTDGSTAGSCIIYPKQNSTCSKSGNLTIKSMGKAAGSTAYRSIQATYNTATGHISRCTEINGTVP